MSNVEAPEMLRVVRDCLRDIGYRESLLIPDYKFRDSRESASSSGGASQQIDLAAFAQSPPSIRSACIGVAVSPDDAPQHIARFRSLGAPQILALHPNTRRITRWKMLASGLPVFLEPTPYEQVKQLFNDNRTDWSPDTILRAKAIAFSSAPLQLSFVDAGYLPALEDELRVKLIRDLNNILAVCKTTFKKRHSEEVFEAVSESLYRLLFRLIAAKYSIDRGKQPGWAELSASDVVREVEAFFSSNRALEPALDDAPTRDAAWQAIRDGLNLSNLSPEILAHLYENTLVTPQLRKQYGIHATPPAVAEYIVSHLPIGDLDKNERRIFEPFCGSAPFLIAGLGQLRTVDTEQISPEEQHDYFQKMLVGMEISPFSGEIAFCALILADDANRDSWQIFGGNAFTSPDFEKHLQWANVVLCNPPHETFVKAKLPKPSTAVYDIQAAEALRRVLIRKPPILGFILPRTFVDGQAFRTLREDIINTYSDVSVVTLPEKVFQKANQKVALLIAHNLREGGHRYYSANVSEDEWETFLRTRQPFDQYEAPTLRRREDGSPVLWRPPLHKLWDYLAQYPTLDAYAEIHRGIEYNRSVDECVFDTPQPHTRPGLQVHDGYLESFYVRKYQHLSNHEEEMRGKAYELHWDQPKVLVNKVEATVRYWRVTGAVDYEQLVASQQFFGVWPRGDMPLELIAALISGPVINAYSFTHEGTRDNHVSVLKEVPVPYFTEEQMELVVSLVQDYSSQRGQWIAESRRKEHLREHLKAKCLELLYQIDAAVLEAYALPPDLERQLLDKFDGAERQPLPFEFPGYGEKYERAKEALQKEKAYRALLKQYHALVDKKYLAGLTIAESEEMERLRQGIDEHNAPFYEPILQALSANDD